MPPKKKSKRGSNLVSLNKAHPKHDVKHDIDAEPDEDFHPEDAPGDESEDDDDDDHLDHGSSNPELEKIRAGGRARQKRSRAAAAAADATPRISTFFRPRATTPSQPPPPPTPPTHTLQPPRGQSPPTVPASPSPPEPFSGNEAGTNADGGGGGIRSRPRGLVRAGTLLND